MSEDPTLNTNSANGEANAATEAAGDATNERIAQLEKENAELKDQWLRAVADYKNFKRRVDQERSDLIRNAGAGVLLKLLPVVDDLERAMGSITPEIAASAWYGGFKLIPQKLQALLESEGVTAIEALGADFDPNMHEAVIYEETDGQEGKVVGDLQRGYKLRDKVLRPSMVKVGKA